MGIQNMTVKSKPRLLKIYKTDVESGECQAVSLPRKALYTLPKSEPERTNKLAKLFDTTQKQPDLNTVTVNKCYYLCSDDSHFVFIYSKRGKQLSPSISISQKALVFGAHWAQKEKLSNWWIREEISTITTTTRKIMPTIIPD
jgi:hypothetical protein